MGSYGACNRAVVKCPGPAPNNVGKKGPWENSEAGSGEWDREPLSLSLSPQTRPMAKAQGPLCLLPFLFFFNNIDRRHNLAFDSWKLTTTNPVIASFSSLESRMSSRVCTLRRRQKCQGTELPTRKVCYKALLLKDPFVEETSCLLIAICTVVSRGDWGREQIKEKVLKAMGMNIQMIWILMYTFKGAGQWWKDRTAFISLLN